MPPSTLSDGVSLRKLWAVVVGGTPSTLQYPCRRFFRWSDQPFATACHQVSSYEAPATSGFYEPGLFLLNQTHLPSQRGKTVKVKEIMTCSSARTVLVAIGVFLLVCAYPLFTHFYLSICRLNRINDTSTSQHDVAMNKRVTRSSVVVFTLFVFTTHASAFDSMSLFYASAMQARHSSPCPILILH